MYHLFITYTIWYSNIEAPLHQNLLPEEPNPLETQPLIARSIDNVYELHCLLSGGLSLRCTDATSDESYHRPLPRWALDTYDWRARAPKSEKHTRYVKIRIWLRSGRYQNNSHTMRQPDPTRCKVSKRTYSAQDMNPT